MNLALPALRHREDRSLLLDRLLAAQPGAEGVQLTAEARDCLLNYEWPGNIRQLLNSLRYAVALADHGSLDRDCLPAQVLVRAPALAGNLADQLGDNESRHLQATLRQHRWNISAAAAQLGVSRSTLYRKMKKHGVIAPNDQP